MGRFDSSRTRVAPVFDHLLASDPTGRTWLHPLLSLGSRVDDDAVPDPGPLLPGHPAWWGSNERGLSPPLELLEWLVENLSEADIQAANDRNEVRELRMALARGDEEVVEEALRSLRGGERGRRWFVLEGRSYPDALLEAEKLVVVVEGKRTERTTTTTTKWMGTRSQLLRHMDAAWEIADGRPVVGLLIVEGRPPDPYSVPGEWEAACEADLEAECVEASLPHRTPDERAAIVEGVLGAVTWQRVCRVFGMPWPPATDILP